METQILEMWNEYIALESYSKSSIDLKGINEIQFLADFKVSDEGIHVNISQTVIIELKKKYPLPQKNKKDEHHLCLGLFSVKKSQPRFNKENEHAVPLFFVMINHLKDDLYKCDKNYTTFLNLADTNLILVPNTPAFQMYFAIERDVFQANVSLMHVLKSITGVNHNRLPDILNTFKKKMEEAYYRNHDKAIQWQTSDILIASSYLDNFSKTLKAEIEKAIEKPQLYSKSESPLAFEYLNGISSSIPEENNRLRDTPYWYGAYSPQFKLSRGQAIVLQHLQTSKRLIAAQGAPGTGKTTLFMSVLANNIVKKALALIKGEDFNNQILIVSTANKAVENAADEFTNSEEFSSKNWIYFTAGNKENIGKSVPRIEKFIEQLQTCNFDKEAYSKAKTNILKLKGNIDNSYKDYCELSSFLKKHPIADIELDLKRLRGQNQKIEELSINHFNLNLLENSDEDLEIIKNSFGAYAEKTQALSNLSDKQIRLIQECDNSYLKELFGQIDRLNWVQKYILRRPAKIYRGIIDQLEEVLIALGIKKDQLQREIALAVIRQKLNTVKKAQAIEVNSVWDDYSLEDFTSVIQIRNDIKELKTLKSKHKAKSEKLTNKYCDNFGEYVRCSLVKENREIYENALEFIFYTMVKEKDKYIESLSLYQDFFQQRRKTVLKKIRLNGGLNNFLNRVSAAYPIVTSTLASSYGLVSDYVYSFPIAGGKTKLMDEISGHQKPFNLILSDESGMTSIHNLFPILCYAERALVVGDPKQLEPIVTLDEYSCQRYDSGFENDAMALMYSPTSVSAFHRAALAKSGDHSEVGDSIVLDEHRRCQKPIAEAFVDIAHYPGMKIKTSQMDLKKGDNLPFVEMGGKHLLFYNTPGKSDQKNTNIEEVNVVRKVIDILIQKGYQPKDIGVITPYKAQQNLLRKQLKGTGLELSSQVGTIHKFQGVEFNVILFSSVIFEPSDSPFFINSKPNMLNVAMSRAKQIFIGVGNFEKLIISGSYLEKMCYHIQKNGLVYDAPLGQGSQHHERNEKRILATCRHLEIFAESFEMATEEIIIAAPWLREMKYGDYSRFNAVKSAVERGVKVVILYGYSNISRDSDDQNTDPQLVEKFKNLLGKNLIRLQFGTHEKVMIVDRREMYIGSFNWLSNQYNKACDDYDKAQIRRETSVRIDDLDVIEEYLQELKKPVVYANS